MLESAEKTSSGFSQGFQTNTKPTLYMIQRLLLKTSATKNIQVHFNSRDRILSFLHLFRAKVWVRVRIGIGARIGFSTGMNVKILGWVRSDVKAWARINVKVNATPRARAGIEAEIRAKPKLGIRLWPFVRLKVQI